MEVAMFWLISLFSPILYLLLSVSSVNYFVVEKNIISFLVLGIVPGTDIQLDFYFFAISLMIGLISILLILLLTHNKLGHFYKLFLSARQERLKNISI